MVQFASGIDGPNASPRPQFRQRGEQLGRNRRIDEVIDERAVEVGTEKLDHRKKLSVESYGSREDKWRRAAVYRL